MVLGRHLSVAFEWKKIMSIKHLSTALQKKINSLVSFRMSSMKALRVDSGSQVTVSFSALLRNFKTAHPDTS